MKILSIAVLLIVLVGIALANFISAEEKIDINNAPLEDLVKIIHIGEARAKELISLRPFSSLDDLARIKGIGSSRINDIKEQGLAWVSQSYKDEPKAIEIQSLPSKELAAVNEPIRQTQGKQIIVIALILAIFSGITILILKNKLK